MYDNNNVFAKILSSKLSAHKIYEDDIMLAIMDINPVAPVHALIIPKGEYVDYSDFVTNADAKVISHFFTNIHKIAMILEIAQSGYRIITNSGESVGQSVFHFHVHLIGGMKLSKLIADCVEEK